jgi:hypothetical protein
MIIVQKRHFQQTPHSLEPVNLLTTEAYQVSTVYTHIHTHEHTHKHTHKHTHNETYRFRQ